MHDFIDEMHGEFFEGGKFDKFLSINLLFSQFSSIFAATFSND